MHEAWMRLDAALGGAADARRLVDIWLRDDDAVTTTAALDRLTAFSRRYGIPVLLAVIPEPADRRLADFVAAESLLTPTQHGYDHTNHALPGARACEMGGDRSDAAVVAEIARGRDKLDHLFGPRRTDILVPPWNRIESRLLAHLPELGFGALSTFGTAHEDAVDLTVLNCDLDIIDWRNGRRCRSEEKLVSGLADLVDADRPIGFLTHHLVHDEEAWAFLDRAFDRLVSHRAVRLTSADTLRENLAHGTRAVRPQ